MKLLQNLTIVLATLLAVANASNSFNSQDSDVSLLSFMARSNNLLQEDPARSLECFNYYIPLINTIATEYEANYKACLNASEVNRAYADNNTLEQRNDLANSADASCQLLSECSEGDNVEGIFQCFIDGGAANIKTMYGINANASQELAALREQYYLIEAQEYRCTNETKRAYEQDSAEAYANLNSCILGNSAVPTEGPSTVKPTSTTESPSTQTEVPSTATAEVDSTTAAPVTDGPATDESSTLPDDDSSSTP